MSSSKRPRRVMSGGDEDEEALHEQQASSKFGQSSSNKRARVSAGPADEHARRRETTPAPEQAAQDGDGASDGRDSPPRTQYEIMRDDGFRHLEHEDDDDQRATQKIRSRSHRVGDNRAAESGIIESVECFNFMCHERLFVELGPLINFVVGENGSGKSAVLTALTLCLGGKASSTNRGGSLKSFIKEGRDQSVIAVSIKNKGLDAYQPELYGNSIKVERHFSRNGTSGFKLRSEREKIISNKKADIDEITEWWGLQVDNPLNVLSQDNARQFLNAATPAHKYKFFFKGVQLEQLDHDYNYVNETLDSHEAKLPEIEERAARAEREYKKARSDKKFADQNQNMRAEGERLRKMVVWSQVVEQERELAKREADIAEIDEKLARDAQDIERTTQKLAEHDDKVAERETSLAEKVQERDVQQEAVNTANERYQEAKNTLTTLHRSERDVHQQLKSAAETVKNVERDIETEKQRLGEGAGRERQKLQEQIDEATSEEERLVAQMEQLQSETIPQLRADTRAAASRADEAAGALGPKKDEIQETQGRIHNMRSKTGNNMDPKIERLLKAIEQDNSFEQQPVGPIGSHIQLLHPAWSSILETTFGQMLSSFLVVSKRDQQRLSALMDKCGIRGGGIVIGKQLPPQVRLREPDENYLTILRALKIENEWVRSQLLINYSVEKIILVSNDKEAREIMFHPDGSPHDVVACLAHHPNRAGGIRHVAKAAGTSLSSGAIMAWRGAPRMKSDAESQMLLEEERLRELQRELRGLQEEHSRLEDNARQCNDEWKKQEDTLKKLNSTLVKVQAKNERLKDQLDQFEGVDDRLSVLQQGLEDALETKEHYGSQYGQIRLQRNESNDKSEQSKAELSAERETLQDLEHQLNKAELKLKQACDLRQAALMSKNKAYDAQTETTERKREAEQLRDQQAEEVTGITAEAQRMSLDRVPIDDNETHSSIFKKYETIRKHLSDRAKQIGRTDEEISRRLSETQQEHNYWSQFHQAQLELHRAGKRSLQDRMRKWRIFQALISAHSRMNFQHLLSERGFRGNILFDHRHRQLQLSVEPDETRKSAAGRNTKTLSGGEKSFSSICMLLAIWDAMGSPLRCLDEFDVFMDNVNRTISTNMLVNAARNSVSKQYIMITPNAIEGRATLDKDVKIIRLTDPRQRTLTGMIS